MDLQKFTDREKAIICSCLIDRIAALSHATSLTHTNEATEAIKNNVLDLQNLIDKINS